MVEVPCKHPHRRKETSTMRIPAILPHELLSWLAENNRFYVSSNVITGGGKPPNGFIQGKIK